MSMLMDITVEMARMCSRTTVQHPTERAMTITAQGEMSIHTQVNEEHAPEIGNTGGAVAPMGINDTQDITAPNGKE